MLFRSEQPLFTGMGIESENGDARRGNSEVFDERAVECRQPLTDSVGRDALLHLINRRMGCQERNAQVAGNHHHQRLVAPRLGKRRFEIFRMSRKGKSRTLDSLLVDRSCDKHVDQTGP